MARGRCRAASWWIVITSIFTDKTSRSRENETRRRKQGEKENETSTGVIDRVDIEARSALPSCQLADWWMLRRCIAFNRFAILVPRSLLPLLSCPPVLSYTRQPRARRLADRSPHARSKRRAMGPFARFASKIISFAKYAMNYRITTLI